MAQENDVDSLVTSAAERRGVPVEVMRAVRGAESGGAGPRATSPAGAQGYMQVMPATYKEIAQQLGLGPDPYKPEDNIDAGAWYLRHMYDRFGNWPQAVSAYNAGPGRVAESARTGQPLPTETQNYAAKVLRGAGMMEEGAEQAAAVNTAAPYQQQQRNIAEMYKQQQAERNQMRALAPPPPEMQPWNQKVPEPDPMRAFGSTATVMGILAGLLSKQPLTAALGAAGTSMMALRAGDLAAYKDAKDTWQKNSEIAIKNAEWEWKSYDRALELMKKDHDAGWAMVQTTATAAQNAAVQQMRDAKTLIDVGGALRDSTTETQKRLVENQKRMDEEASVTEDAVKEASATHPGINFKIPANQLTPEAQRMREEILSPVRDQIRRNRAADAAQARHKQTLHEQMVTEYQVQHPGSSRIDAEAAIAEKISKARKEGGLTAGEGVEGTKANYFKVRTDELKAANPNMSASDRVRQISLEWKERDKATLDEKTLRDLAERIIKGEQLPRYALRGNDATRLENTVSKILTERNLPSTAITAAKASLASYVQEFRSIGQRAATLETAAKEAELFIPQVRETSKTVDFRGRFKDLNALLLAAANRTGGTAVVEYGIAINGLVNAYAQVITRGSQSTDTARAKAASVLQEAWSKGQIESALKQIGKEIEIARQVPDASRQDLEKLLLQRAGASIMAAGSDTLTDRQKQAVASMHRLDLDRPISFGGDNREEINAFVDSLPPGQLFVINGREGRKN